MKAVLVIDMPDMCLNCDLYAFQSCYPLQRRINRDGLKMVDKPEWCPLKDLPQKKNTDFHPNIVYANGWNDCLKEITE